jgi:outer membrane protein TolC
MKNIKKLIGLLFVLMAFMTAAQQEELNNYLKIAAENNPGLKARFNDYLAALERVPQVSALPDPQISFGYFIQPIETRNGPQQFRISANQVFPWFGIQGAKGDVAAQVAKTKYEVFQEEKAKLFNEVRSNYYNLYFTKKAMVIMEENIKILQSFRQLALIKVEAGIVSAVDEYRIEMDLNDMENQQILLSDNFMVQSVQFKNLLNDSTQYPIILPDNLWETDFQFNKNQLLDSIRTLNHQLLKIDYEKELLVLEKEVDRLEDRPGFSVGVDYINVGKGSNNLSGKDAFIFPKIGFSIPIFRKKYKAIVNEVALLESAKEFEKQDKNNWLENIFELSYKNYKDASRRLDLFRTQTELAKKSLRILETEYATNNANFEELLRIEKQLLRYSLELEKAKADKQAAISFVHYLMGK